ncbi:2707_t:CDS:2 [Acaulospora colombiana]|uniref:2707_t:CDS:1 n=1 Tax=Acaulospora colombiana TaxID=27376 RepID=A0ACA9L0L0_9GLOM|nr:2707_t:CDS:2 [Acaulospora colombiana]
MSEEELLLGSDIELTSSGISTANNAGVHSRVRFQEPETAGSTSTPSMPQSRSKKQPYPLMINTDQSTSNASGSRSKPIAPLRTTKTSQKLVLLPEETGAPAPMATLIEDLSDAAETPITPSVSQPIFDFYERTDAERMNKEVRNDAKYPRVTAYCTAEGYYLGVLMEFLKKEHNVQPKRYDECVYAPYHFPLLSGRNAKLISSAPTRSPNGHTFMDRQIENYENGNGINPYFVTDEIFDNDERGVEVPMKTTPSALDNIGEIFYFDYGVVVFWNLTEEQEFLCLDDLASAGVTVRPLKKEDIESETFHFQYDFNSTRQPRIFNDMITLKTDNHMIKLTISHALSQSTKLTLYEWQMEDTIEKTSHIPKMLAQTGRNRTLVTKLTGELFKLRMQVNLVSNVLDTPEIFWSEPSLQPLYNAIRAYLEISQRAKLLNERCNVLSDLLDMLREDVGNTNMTKITWIIIWLIVVAVLVAIGEIAVKALNHYG